MSTIPFTDRELKKAWRELSSIVNPATAGERKNPHRLLLFYAVECGLKVVWLKRQNCTLFDQKAITETGHDLRRLLTKLRVDNRISLPRDLQLQPVDSGRTPRQGDITILHQAWRYGGECRAPTDLECEAKLLKVLEWIQGELK
ncbi:MAG: hypothetical protein HQL98_15220 [Magnetococcales bacterium]|nr:hypothetical protein [Magnetococcales bacterium]